MKQFNTNHQDDVMGVLNGLDRIRFRGTQRWLATVGGMMSFLWKVPVKLKEFKGYALDLTTRLKRDVEALAEDEEAGLRFLWTMPRCPRRRWPNRSTSATASNRG